MSGADQGPKLYALRQRHIKRGFRPAETADGAAAAPEAAAVATLAVGLKPGEMTKLERQLFSNRMKDYIRCRDKILVKWWENCSEVVDLHQLLAEEADSRLQVLRDAYYFLQEHGYINFGVVKERPPPEAPREQEEQEAADGEDTPAVEDDRAIAFKLYELLRAADMETTSEKALRKQLQQHFKTDMNEKKAFIKEHVNYFIQHLDRKDTLEPLGFEGSAGLTQQQLREQKKAAAAARAALAAPPPTPPGRVIVVGAGPAGLAAATQLQRNNVDVVVLEARSRVGGRVHSYTGPGFSAPVDLGASLITGTAPDAGLGLAPDPTAFLVRQLGIPLHTLGGELPIYDAGGQQVSPEVDAAVDKLRDELLDEAQEGAEADPAEASQQSLGQALEAALQQRLKATQRQQQQQQQPDGGEGSAATGSAPAAAAEANGAAPDGGDGEERPQQPDKAADEAAAAGGGGSTAHTTPDMLRLLDWHWANLEYGCSASLSQVSLPHWNQDEEWGGFGGPHAMVCGGCGAALQGLAAQLGDKLRLSCAVRRIDYSAAAAEDGEDAAAAADGSGDGQGCVRVTLADGEVLEAALVLVTVPLGVLQSGGVEFVPALPEWKAAAVSKLGFGDLNKVVMQFPAVFWDPAVDFFGVVQQPGEDSRGRCFMFWNLAGCNDGTPLLAALVSGRAARDAEGPQGPEQLPQHMLESLRRVFGDKVPEPVAVKVTQWASDEFSKGSYSYVAVGCTGQEYDSLALPVARCVLFAGEHTCRQHPDSVGGAMLSGLREAARALQLLRGPSGAAVAELVGARTETMSKTDKRKRHEEADEGRAKRAKHDKKERKQRQEKEGSKEKKRGRSGKKEKGVKVKQESGSSDDEEADSESEGDERGRRKGSGRQRRAAAPPEQPVRRTVDMQALRNELSRLWTGLLDAERGECLTVLDVMRNSDSLEGRQQIIDAISKSPAGALTHLCGDPVFLSTLNTWLADLVVERSDANLHVLLRLLELMKGLTAASWASLTASGLLLTVKKAAGHRNRDVAGIGSTLLKDWSGRDPSKQKAPEHEKPRTSGGVPSVLNLFGPSWQPTPPGGFGQQWEPHKQQQQQRQQQPHPQQQQQPRQQQPQQPQKQPQGQQQQQRPQPRVKQEPAEGGAGAGPGSNGAVPQQLHAYLTDQERQDLEAREAAYKAAQQQAAAAAAELEAIKAEAPSKGRIKLESFGEFSRSSKRQRDGADEPEAPARQHHHHQHHQHQHDKHHHHHHSSSSRPGGSRHDTSTAAAPVAAAAAAGGGSGGGGAEGTAEGKARATKQLSDFVKASLKPRFQSKELDNDDCKWLLQKVVSKVMDATTGADTATDDFMTAKRVSKVTALIDSYVERRKAEKRSGSGAAAPVRRVSTGRVSATAPTP